MPASPDTYSEQLSRGLEPVTTTERVMASLGVFNVLLLVVHDAYAALLPRIVNLAVVPVDLALVAVFAVELIARARRADSTIGYLRTHWYDVVGVIPVTSATFRAFRLVRLLRMYVVTHAEPREDASWHVALARGLVVRFRSVIVEEITAPILRTALRLSLVPLRRARLASVAGRTLESQRGQIRAVVRKSLSETKGVNRLSDTEAGSRFADAVTNTVLDTVVGTLDSDEMNDLLADSVEQVVAEVTRNVSGTGSKPMAGPATEVDVDAITADLLDEPVDDVPEPATS